MDALNLDFRALFESAPGCFVVLSPSLEVVAASNAFLEALGSTREEAIGKSIFDFGPFEESDVIALRRSLENVLAERRPHSSGTHAHGPRHWRRTSSPVFGDAGHVAYIFHHLEDVTERIALEKQEQAAELRARQLLDTAPDAMVVVDAAGLIQLVNVQTERMFGYRRDELLGRPLEILVPERFRGGHGAHLRRFFTTPTSRPMGTGLELYGRTKAGVELPIEVSLSPLESESGVTVSAAIRDITERKRLEASTKILAARLASAVESIQDAFALFDEKDHLVLCNSVYRRLLDDSMGGPLVNQSYRDLLEAWSTQIAFPPGTTRAAFIAERLLRHSDPTSTFDVNLRDGRVLRVIDRRTADGGMVKTIWDLTSDAKTASELRDARLAAEAGSAAKTEFLSSMSHELRTPMNAILGFAQLLQRDKKEPLSARHRERVDQILNGGEHLLRLIDDILDLSRIEAGSISVAREPVSVREVLDDVKRTLEPLAARDGIRLEIAPVPPAISLVWADRTRFLQVLTNFGSNAVKYNRPSGSVTFVVSSTDASRVRVTIQDTGLGIARDKQDKLFQPFQRAGQETGSIEGTGIGLVISQRLARLMDGEVGFSSEPGVGSSFWIELPSHVAARVDPATASQERDSGTLADGPSSLVLYVEDNPANVSFMRDLLGSFENIELIVAPTAELGLELIRSRRPAVVIMDINLPGMSGTEALGVLRKEEGTKDIPVIALTAAASERDRQKGIEAGFYRYLTKPVKVDELISALESLLV